MLPYHQQAWEALKENPSALVVFGRGLDQFEIIKQLIIDYSARHELVFIFGLGENEKQRIIWESANASIEFLPKDIEKDTGKKDRVQFYDSNLCFFHNPGILSKDFLNKSIDPLKISGMIVANADTIHKDPGLQMCLAYYKSKNQAGFVKAFTERVYEVTDIQKTLDLLWIRFVLFYPRFDKVVSESISSCGIQIIKIPLKKKINTIDENEFSVIVAKDLSRAFGLLMALFENVVQEFGSAIGLESVHDAIVFHRKSLERRATTDEQVKVLQSIVFLKRALHILLHEDSFVFLEFLEANRRGSYDLPHWMTFPQVNALFSTASSLVETGIPAPKLQWVTKLMSDLPKDKKILILAEGTGTIGMITSYLSGFTPRTAGCDAEIPLVVDEFDRDDDYVDIDIFGVIQPPMIMVQEIHAQADVLEKFQPDFVIYWDITLPTLRRLEVYNARYHKDVTCYVLCYEEAKELDSVEGACIHENKLFIQTIQTLQSLTLPPLIPFASSDRTIIVDDREFRSGFPLALFQVGFQIIPALLVVGDYVLTDDICIERKAFNDLTGSLRSGRLLSQLIRMKTYYERPMLLIEFSDAEYNSLSSRDRSMIYLNKIMTILTNFPTIKIIWGRNCLEAAKTLLSLATNQKSPSTSKAISMGLENKDVSLIATRPMKFLSSIPFLTSLMIEVLSTRCKNLKQLIMMPRDELMRLIDPAAAIKLYSFMHSKLKESPSQ